MRRLIHAQANVRSTPNSTATFVRKSGARCVNLKKAGHNPAFNLLPFVSRLCNMQISMCLLCPLPTGSPMTPASRGVRRMLFGYPSHSRCWFGSRRWFAEYPRLYTLRATPYTLHLYALHSTPYTGIPVICHVHGGGSPCLPCFRVNPCSSVGGLSPTPVVFCQWSGNILASFLSLPWLSCARGFPRE